MLRKTFWTGENVETMRRLWLDGRSASYIAVLIGAPSRNAVIGKLHRIGLNGRREGGAPTANHDIDRRWTPEEDARVAEMRRAGASSTAIANAIGRTAAAIWWRLRWKGIKPPVVGKNVSAGAANSLMARMARMQNVAVLAARFECEAGAQPADGGITIVDLTERTCHWPLGDPGDLQTFRYCGAKKSLDAGPYCRAHRKIAYQPANPPTRARGTVYA
jgi:GcrA cell cycle regulator